MSSMRDRIGTAIAAAIFVAVSASPALAEETSPALSVEQVQEIEEIIRDVLLNNPEIIVDAINNMRQKERAAEKARAREAIAENRMELEAAPGDPIAGNPSGDVTVVEFFDYRCPYCKRVAGPLLRTVEEDGNIKLVFKEFPILGPKSDFAARVALASKNQERYIDFHVALMQTKAPLTEEAIFAIADRTGLDTDRLRADMTSPEVEDMIARNLRLADAINIRGTPAFIVGERLVPGALSMESLKQLVAEVRGSS